MSLYLKNGGAKKLIGADEKIKELNIELQESRQILRQLKYCATDDEFLKCQHRVFEYFVKFS